MPRLSSPTLTMTQLVDVAIDCIEKHYESGQHAALRGCFRVLSVASSADHYAAWYAGYDSVPRWLRGSAPLTGRIPEDVLLTLAESSEGG